MKKTLIVVLTIFVVVLSACSNSSTPQSAPSDGELPAISKLAIGTIKLDGTENAVTSEQASTLLPLWQVYQSLLDSDTAAQEEITALAEQIGTTMTSGQSQAISDMQITQQDMFGIMQEQGMAMGGTQTNNSGTQSSTNNFGPPGGGNGFGPPDGAGFPSGGTGGSSGQSSSSNQSSTAKQSSGTRTNRTPTVLIEAVIKYLQEKAGS